jgi:leukotriene-A4 hydrolase
MMRSAAYPTRRFVAYPLTPKSHIDPTQGFHFLYYLEKVVGKSDFDKFIPHYFKTWQKKSLDSYEFKVTLLDFFAFDKTISKALAGVDWDSWFYKPGLPPKPKFDTSMVDKCYALADKWESDKVYPSSSPSPDFKQIN